jgi:putative tricarboxylic transport membrane protein
MIDNLLTALSQAAQPVILLAIVVGVVLGYIVGALPGLGPAVTVALLLPFTYDMSPLTSLAMLTALYMAAQYAGSITAVLMNIPGEAGATATTFDGYPLTKQGKPQKALGMSMGASFFGGLVSTVGLMFAAIQLGEIALRFGPPEYFALAVFGLTVAATLGSGSQLKALIAVCVGLLVSTIGLDALTGSPRYTYVTELYEGITLVPALIGLFAISEVLVSVEQSLQGAKPETKLRGGMPTTKEYRYAAPAMVRGSIIGFLIGVLPGAGASVSSFVAYSQEKRSSRHPETFGKGDLRGVAAPEASNNAAVSGSLVPLLALGIPGSATAAILIGAFLIHGLTPGPLLFQNEPDLIYGLFGALFVGNFVMLALGLGGVRLWARVTLISPRVLMPLVLALSLVAAYSDSNTIFDVWVAIAFGVVGYAFRRFDFPIAPIVLAIVLGKLVEGSFRRSMVISGGSLDIFLQRPLALVLLALTIVTVLWPLLAGIIRRRRMPGPDGGRSRPDPGDVRPGGVPPGGADAGADRPVAVGSDGGVPRAKVPDAAQPVPFGPDDERSERRT